MKTEALAHLLELAGPAWEHARWADGIFGLLDGPERLLESIAVPEDGAASLEGEF